MKKIISLLIAVATFLLMQSCVLTYDSDTLTEKFEECYNEIDSIVDRYSIESRYWVTDESQLLREYYLVLSDKSIIDIEFSTYATESQKGNGTFSISYTIPNISDENNFDVELFTEIANSVSGKTITADFVTEFLTAPEEKYSVEKYGLNGGGYAVEKMHALNFWEDWVIGYELTYDGYAKLWFYGYIK